MYSKMFFKLTQPIGAKMLMELLAKETIVWKKTLDPLKPYETKIANEQLHLRVNDFPEEPLYSVMHKDKPILDTNNFHDNWFRHEDLGAITAPIKP